MLSITSFLSSIFFIFIAILVLLFMVVVHELGHYVSGKLLGFKINEFSIGFGKALYKKTRKNGEVFAIRPIPLGGYCAFEGEDEDNSNPKAFNNQKGWKRLIVLFSGAFMNFIVSIIIIIAVFTVAGINFLSVHQVYPPAQGAVVNPLQEGDVLIKVNNQYMYMNNLSSVLKDKEIGENILVTVYRDGEMKDIYVHKDKFVTIDDNGEEQEFVGLGIMPSYQTIKMPFFKALVISLQYSYDMATFILKILWQLVTFQMSIFNLGGPISTIGITAEVARSGFRNLLDITSMIGLNLAVFNLLPFPALDGARMTFVGIEMIRKKKINPKIEGAIHAFGIVFLFSLVMLVDIVKIIL